MQKRHMIIALAVAALVVVFAASTFFGLNQAPSVDGSVTSTESESRGNDSGIAAPAGAPSDTVAPAP
jgi:hypothetical protein